ncbi:MAG: enoyl-CoA hydratase [Acidimicrobiales bacterium]|nr:enoyl-CoA hydratase [Acidimicrobiales bacterium]
MADESLLVEVADGVATVTLNRPEARNALNGELLAGVPRALRGLDERDDVRAIVLTGTDPAFCAGLDLRALSTTGGRERAETGPSGGASEIALGELPFAGIATPLIGAVNGPAVTGGLEYALNCDFLVASERARFADTHARVGIMPGWGLTVLLPQAVGIRRARQMSYTGNFVDAHTALAWGLVNVVVPHSELLTTARALAADIASIPARQVQRMKATYAATLATHEADAFRVEGEMSREWMSGFEPTELAANREAIQRRGRSQLTD